MMVSLRWVIFINLGLTFLFFSRILAILKKKAGGKRPFFEFLPSRKFKKNKKQSGCFFIFLSFGNPQKKAGGKMPFFFPLPIPEIQKKQKNSKLFLGFFPFFEFWQSSKRKLVGRVFFLIFLNSQKESWWEESFFLNFLFFLNLGHSQKGSWWEVIIFFCFFLIFLIFLNLGHSQKGSWWEVFIFFDFFAGHIIS